MTVLVVAKAPVAGRAKTRLAAAVGDRLAADIAAAALADTLDAVAAAPVAGRVVSLAGDLDAAAGGAELRARLRDFTVIDQHGGGFADRLANAHADAAAAAGGLPVCQIGMDTPQVGPALLAGCARVLLAAPAVLGPAGDGGWWLLGLHTPAGAECLRGVAMSHPHTAAQTLRALRGTGVEPALTAELCDVDTVGDIAAVRKVCPPQGRFARVTAAAGL